MAALAAKGAALLPVRLSRVARALWGWRVQRGLGQDAGPAGGAGAGGT